jgi:hypothetical protein
MLCRIHHGNDCEMFDIRGNPTGLFHASRAIRKRKQSQSILTEGGHPTRPESIPPLQEHTLTMRCYLRSQHCFDFRKQYGSHVLSKRK